MRMTSRPFLAVRCFLTAASFIPALAGAAERTLEVRDPIGKAWSDEPISWELSFQPGEWRGDRFRVTRDGRPVVAQLVPGERHADGSVKSAAVLFVIDALAPRGRTAIALATDTEGPPDTDLRLTPEPGALVVSNRVAAVKVLDRNGEGNAGDLSPVLGVRTPSGKWTAAGSYRTTTTRPVRSRTEVLERGPVRARVRVVTSFDNGRRHTVVVSLWTGSPSVEISEEFDLGPDSRYRFKEFGDDRDELGWEWWSWYGDKDGTKEAHADNWVLDLSAGGFEPRAVRYRGEASTDPDKGAAGERGESGYTLSFAAPRRLEKYLAAHDQWRPDAVTWYAAGASSDPSAEVLALYTHSARLWRNPNVLPLPRGITLRTGANDLRLWTESDGKRLVVEAPLGLGARTWALRAGTAAETFRPAGASPTALSAEIVKRCLGLDVVRRWIVDWDMTLDYPRLFIGKGEKEAFYARLKGQGIGSPGNFLDTFLRQQDAAGFERDYAEAVKLADGMIAGYFSTGCDLTNGHPGWMLGYWHGISVANALDVLAGSPLCPPEKTRALKAKLAILTYCLASRDAWPDKRINYGWGSMNMPVGRWGGLVVMASALSDHPAAREWLRDASRCFRMLLRTQYAPDGTHISCPHYIGASSTSFYAWIALARSGLAEDVSTSPELQRFARYYAQLLTPVDPRWGIRTLLTEGDSRPGSSPLPGILATLFKRSAPDLAGELIGLWREGGSDLSSGMGVPDLLIIDPTIPPRPPRLGSQVFPGFGAFLRHRALGTPEESYLAFLAGDFMIDHTNSDVLAFQWHEKGVPLSVFCGSMYQPMASTALSHDTVCWDIVPGGAPDPGKDQPGNWYHDRGQPWVDLGGVRPRLHWEVGCDRETQDVLETRGRVSLASDLPGASLLEGRVLVKALTETPTRADHAIAIASQAWPPATRLPRPFLWRRRLLCVNAPAADGMNYMVVRDDFDGFTERTPYFQYWSLSEDVALNGRTARFAGQLGVDTDLVVLEPKEAALAKDSFTHDQCEPIVSGIHQRKHGTGFTEKQVVCRVEGRKGAGFLVIIFPRKAVEPAPSVAPWGDGGAEVSWKGETHRVLLDVEEREVRADGVEARASCLVLKSREGTLREVDLPAGGRASVGGRTLEGTGPCALDPSDGRSLRVDGSDLMRGARR